MNHEHQNNGSNYSLAKIVGTNADSKPENLGISGRLQPTSINSPEYVFANKGLTTEYIRKKLEIVEETSKQIVKKHITIPEQKNALPSINIDRLADQIYSLIERKARIERERRGL